MSGGGGLESYNLIQGQAGPAPNIQVNNLTTAGTIVSTGNISTAGTIVSTGDIFIGPAPGSSSELEINSTAGFSSEVKLSANSLLIGRIYANATQTVIKRDTGTATRLFLQDYGIAADIKHGIGYSATPDAPITAVSPLTSNNNAAFLKFIVAANTTVGDAATVLVWNNNLILNNAIIRITKCLDTGGSARASWVVDSLLNIAGSCTITALYQGFPAETSGVNSQIHLLAEVVYAGTA